MFDRRESLYVGNLGPIPLYIHWTFLFLLWSLYRWSPVANPGFVDLTCLATVMISGIVLHELGHGLTGRAFGTLGTTITLWALGGVCSSTRDRQPVRELFILAAGPAVSFLLATLAWIAYTTLMQTHPRLLVGSDEWLPVLDYLSASPRHAMMALYGEATPLGKLLALGFSINLTLGIFNMLPIYPLDGGQIVYNAGLLFLRQRAAAALSLTIAVLGVAGGLAYIWHTNGTVSPFTVIMALWILYNAFNALR